MLKNNLKSLAIHLIISFICLVSFELQGEIIGYRLNVLGSNDKNFVKVKCILALIIFILSAVLYYVLAKRYLEKLSFANNIMSVISVVILGTVLWSISNKSNNSGDSFLKLYYQIYNAYSLPLFSVFNIKNSYLAGIFALIPGLLMWMGIQSK
jgi:hypothetical protein